MTTRKHRRAVPFTAAASFAAALLLMASLTPEAQARPPLEAAGGSSSAQQCTAPEHVSDTVTVSFDAGTQTVSVDPMIVEVPFCTVATITWVPADGNAYRISSVRGCASWGFTHAAAPAGRIRLVDANTDEARRKDWYYQASVTDRNGKKGSSQPCKAEDPPVIHNG